MPLKKLRDLEAALTVEVEEFRQKAGTTLKTRMAIGLRTQL
jgi:hypothetical protein